MVRSRSTSFIDVLKLSIEAYKNNFETLSVFSIPFVVIFPLVLFLPNFTSLGGIFLRYASLANDTSPIELLLIAVAFCISLLLFSFGLVIINMAVKTQRTLKEISFYEIEKIENYTFQLFSVFFIAALLTIIVNIALFDSGLSTTLGALIGLFISLLVLFAPQVVVIDGQNAHHAISMSLKVLVGKFTHFIGYLLTALVLLSVNSLIFLTIGNALSQYQAAALLSVVVNAIFIVPFLEVLKSQIYLSKYTLL